MQYTAPFRATDARRLADVLAAENVPIPAPLAAAVRLADDADQAKKRPTARALDLDADALLAHAQALAVHDLDKLPDLLSEIADAGAREAAEELRAGGLDPVIEALRPSFDKAAAVVNTAAKLGITSSTTPADIIERDDPRVVDAWRALKPAIRRLDEIATLRISLSTTLDLAPTIRHIRNAIGSSLDVVAVDYSCAFVAGDGWTTDGRAYLQPRPGSGIDWLKIADGLYLNSISETERLLARRSAAAARVTPLDQDARAVLTRR